MKPRFFNPEIVLGLVIAILWTYFSFFHGFDDDEFQHCHNVYLIWKGLAPYRDFFEHHLPLYQIIFSPLFIFGERPSTIFLFRLLSLICSGCVFLVMYRRLKQDYGRIVLFCFALVAFVPMYLFKMTEARPESVAILLFVLAFTYVFSQNTEKHHIFLAGAMSGLMVCFSLKYVYAWAGLCASCFVLKRRTYGISFLCGFLTGIFPLFLYVLTKGIFPEFINCAMVMNAKWKYSFSPAGYLYELFMTAGVIVACAISGIIGEFFVKESRRKALAGLLLLLGCFFGVVLVPVPYRQSFLPLIVGCVFCSLPFVKNFFQIIQDKRAKYVVAAIIFICATSNGLIAIKNEIPQTNRIDLQAMKKIDEISSGTPFFDGRALMFYRMHTGYYGFMHHELLQMLDAEEYSNHIIEAIKRNNFPVVIYDYRVRQMPAKIQDFIQSHYCLAAEPDIYMPGVKIDRSQFVEGRSDFEINVSGWYIISFKGEDLLIDDMTVESGDIRFFEIGIHTAKSSKFIDNLAILLRKR
ncbi:MAG: hypothetical protein NC831_03375 [Candidatus Omnitrophica bacterium]|nr:hypothetical protein [Candidatus Omnitrophota bacterium]MCM8827828.1 hypothetical protein [Candidatus Omnitrophota bacterium]